MIKAACRTFPASTGGGIDSLQLRSILRLSDQVSTVLCHLLMPAELHGQWPELIQTIMVVLLPKADGGRRPIGLLPKLVRVWMRVRGPTVRAWRTSLNKEYLYGGEGKGEQRAAWMQAAKAEAARSARRGYGVYWSTS